jgi:tight adherence protein B
MNITFAIFVILGFVAVVLLLEGGFVLWNDNKSPEVKRIEGRLRAISAGTHEQTDGKLYKERVLSNTPALHRLLLRLPRVHQIDRLLIQSGSTLSVWHFILICGFGAFIGLLCGLVLRWSFLWIVVATALMAVLPVVNQIWKSRKRLQRIEAQLPDAMDLISRALRAGHSFPSALSMVGNEAQDPIASEFKTTFDEISFGISNDQALNNLAARVPSADLRYFVMAVIIQRETGGNLSELLGKLSTLIRERFKLFGKIRVLAAEGKLSAWILTALPFGVAGVIYILNPEYISILFTDPLGVTWVIGALIMMAIGIFSMWRIIDIHV